MAQTYEDAVHNAIVTLIKSTLFPRVTYSAAGVRTTASSGTISAKSVNVEPVQGVYGVSNNRSSWARDISEWRWEADISFSRAVSLESFLDAFASNPITISRETSGLDRQVLVSLAEVVYEIPPTGQPSSGTKASIQFTVVLSPK